MLKKVLIGLGVVLMLSSIYFYYASYNKNGGCYKEEVCTSEDDNGNCLKWEKGDTYVCDSLEHNAYIIRRLVYGAALSISGVMILCTSLLLPHDKKSKEKN